MKKILVILSILILSIYGWLVAGSVWAQTSYELQPLPYPGHIKLYPNAKRIAPLEIKASKGDHYLIKLVYARTKSAAMTIFVRSGTTVTVDVPLNSYEIRYASGKNWYGYKYLFGPDTLYFKAKKTLQFKRRGNNLMGFTFTFHNKGRNWKLYASKIRPEDF